MKLYQQAKKFSEFTSDNEPAVNEFLKEKGGDVINVFPLYNAILGGIEYVVIYWHTELS